MKGEKTVKITDITWYTTPGVLTPRSFIGLVHSILAAVRSYHRLGFVSEDSNLPLVSDILKAMGPLAKGDTRNTSLNLWLYHYIILNLYKECLVMKNEESFRYQGMNVDSPDLTADLEVLSKDLVTLLHPLIIQAITRVGVSIDQNVYIGYDTEYELDSPALNLNRLLSVQLAINTRVILKIPTRPVFEIEDSNRGGVQGKTSEELYIFKALMTSIRTAAYSIRDLKFGGYDRLMDSIVKALDDKILHGEDLISVEGVKGNRKAYCFPLSKPINFFEFQSSYTLENLLQVALDKSVTSLESGVSDISKILSGISESLSIDSHKIVPSITLPAGALSLYTVDSTAMDKKVLRGAVSRFRVPSHNCQVSISSYLNVWLAAHLSGADLSMLRDFDSFKEDLSIIGKGFVTMRPIKRD